MCIACLEYQKGTLDEIEYLRNRREIGEDVDHDESINGIEVMGKYLSQIFDEETK